MTPPTVITAAERNARAMTLLQLWGVVTAAPDRRVLWTPMELAAEAELDRRLAPRVAA